MTGSPARTPIRRPRVCRLDDLPAETLKPGLTRRILSGGQAMVAQIQLTANTDVPRHSHHNEQITYVLEGTIRIELGTTDDEAHTLRAGDTILIPSDAPHSAIALKDTITIEFFAPPRQDWLSGTDAYLRQ